MALIVVLIFQNCGQEFQADHNDQSLVRQDLPSIVEDDEEDDDICPAQLKAGMNTNAYPNRVWDKSRIVANFGIAPSATYSCRSDQIVPYKIDPPNRMEGTPEYNTFMEPLRTHSFRLATITTNYIRYRSETKAAAECAIDWILPWADAEIFTEKAGTTAEGGAYLTRQGDYERAFYVSSFALAYAIVKDEPGLDSAKKQEIEAWLLKIGTELMSFSDLRKNKDGDVNNIYYWSGYSLMTIGLVLNNSSFINRGIAIYDVALNEINDQGLLPRELERAEKSFWYHNYALTPLIHMAEIARPYGHNLYERSNGRIHLLAKKLIDGFTDFTTFPDYQSQIETSTPEYFLTDNSREIGWMEIYYSRFADTKLKPLLAEARKTNNGALKFSMRTHGSATHLFGVKCL